MADEKILNETAGKIISPYSQAMDTGVTYELMMAGKKQAVSLLSGTIGADTVRGTDGTDIIVSNGTGRTADGKPGTDLIDGKKGIDMAVLPGKQSDWTPKMPKATDYPGNLGKEFWSNSPQQAYGRVLVMEHKDGSRVILQDVESVVFADNKFKFESGGMQKDASGATLGEQPVLPPSAVVELEKAMKSGTVKSISTTQALADAEKAATPEQQLSARMQSTFKAQEVIASIPPIKRGTDLNAFSDKVGSDLQKGGADFVNKVKTAPLVPTI